MPSNSGKEPAVAVSRLGLYELLAPQFLVGFTFPEHVDRYLSVLGVDELRTAHDDDASVYVGRCSFVGDAGAAPVREHRDPSGAVLRWEDVTIDFRLTLPRDGAAFVGTAVGAAAAAGAPELKALFDRLGPVEGTAVVATEYPGIRFRLELMLSLLTFHLGPAWLPGTMDAEHRVIPDPSRASDDVAFLLPKVTFVYEQGDDLTRPPTFELASWGSGGFDAPHDLAAGEVVRMEPPLAIHESGRVGFGVGQVVLDLSENSTPPEILRFFGVDEGWKGIYVRSARVFWSDKDKGWAVNVAVEDMLVSFAGQVSLEASLDVIGPEARMRASVHLFEGPQEVPYVKGTTTAPVVAGQATILNTGVVHVHIAGGVPPYVVHARLGSEELWNPATRQALVSPGGAAALRAPVRATLHVSVTDSGTTTPPNPTRQAYIEDIDLTVRGAAVAGAPRDGAPADRPPDPAPRPDAVFSIVASTPSTLPPGYDVTCTPSASGLTERVVVAGPPGATVTVGGVARALDATGSFSLDVAETADIPILVTWPDPAATATPARQTFRLHFASGGPRADLDDVGFDGALPSYVADTENPPDIPFGRSIPDGGPPTPTGAAGLKRWITDSVATGADAHITIDAHTAFVRSEDAALDQQLSERRRDVASAIIRDARPDAMFDHALAHGHAAALASADPRDTEHDVAIIQAGRRIPGEITPTYTDMLNGWITMPLTRDWIEGRLASGGMGFEPPWELKEGTPITMMLGLRDAMRFRDRRPLTVGGAPHDFVRDDWDAAVAMDRLRSHQDDGALPEAARRFELFLRIHLCYPTRFSDPVDKLLGHDLPSPPRLPVVVIAHGNHDSWTPSEGTVAVPGPGVTVTTVTGGTQQWPLRSTVAMSEHDSHKGYEYLQDEFARQGIVSVSIDCNFANYFGCWVQTRADLIKHVVSMLAIADGAATGRLRNRLDLDNIAFIGHSRGGDGVVQAAKDLRASVSPFDVKAVCAIAPTDVKGGRQDPLAAPALTDSDAGFYYLLYGALDGDVYGEPASSAVGTGFRHYDRAACQKAATYLERCCHNGFNSVWLDDRSDIGDGRLRSGGEHEQLALEYIGDLIRWRLKGEQALSRRFDGRLALNDEPNGATNALRERASLLWSFGSERKVLDDFQRPSATSLGVPRTMPPPAEVRLMGDVLIAGFPTATSMDPHTPHRAIVAHVNRSTTPTPGVGILRSTIPAADRDWRRFDVLTFSLSGWYDPSSDARLAATPTPQVRITLTDAANRSATVGWETYGAELPKRPIRKTISPGQGDPDIVVCLMPFATVPVALTAFSGIDLAAIAAIAFDAEPAATSHVFLDDITLVKR